MTTRDPAVKEKLTWRRPRMFRREYEMMVKEQMVACLRQTGFFSWQAEIFEGGWSTAPVLQVQRTGAFRQKLHVKSLDYRFPHLTKPTPISLRGEVTLELDNGRSYHFGPTNFWQTRWQLKDEVGKEYLDIQRNKWGFGGEITITNSNLPQDELLFLLYVTWYVVILKMEDQAAAAAAAS